MLERSCKYMGTWNQERSLRSDIVLSKSQVALITRHHLNCSAIDNATSIRRSFVPARATSDDRSLFPTSLKRRLNKISPISSTQPYSLGSQYQFVRTRFVRRTYKQFYRARAIGRGPVQGARKPSTAQALLPRDTHHTSLIPCYNEGLTGRGSGAVPEVWSAKSAINEA